jgi:hypothetical protein
MSKETNKRVVRKPMFQRGPQSISGEKDPNFHYRFVNDTGSRVHNFQQAGYELVTDTELAVGDSRVFDPSDLGSAKRVISNDGTTSYLMRIKNEYYNEDQAAKAEQINEMEGSMNKEASQGMYGSIKMS